jgi:hypothetical protein
MHAMKKILLFGFLVFVLAGCKKIIEAAQENTVMKAMTDGQWKVTRFKRDSADATVSFAPYLFQFRTDNTVEAINNNAVESKGNWTADATARTIASSFGSNAAATLQLLNGTWAITNNSWTFVEATQTVNGEVRTLRLEK